MNPVGNKNSQIDNFLDQVSIMTNKARSNVQSFLPNMVKILTGAQDRVRQNPSQKSIILKSAEGEISQNAERLLEEARSIQSILEKIEDFQNENYPPRPNERTSNIPVIEILDDDISVISVGDKKNQSSRKNNSVQPVNTKKEENINPVFPLHKEQLIDVLSNRNQVQQDVVPLVRKVKHLNKKERRKEEKLKKKEQKKELRKQEKLKKKQKKEDKKAKALLRKKTNKK